MPEWMTVKNMTMFANEVIPLLRAKGTSATVEAGRELAAAGVK
jgi:hypothetical protein